jgi:subtilisin family serine protease
VKSRRFWRPLSAAAALALLLVAVPARGAAETTAWPSDAVAGALVVTAADEDRLARVLADFEDHRKLSDRVGLVRVPPGSEAATAAAVRSRPGVTAAEPDRLRPLAAVPDDPRYPEQWAHRQARIEDAWAFSVGSHSVRVAVIDSGVRGDHPDLRPNVVEQVDVSTGTVIEVGRGVDNDTCELGHGTMVAGVIGAAGDNGRDIAGVAWHVSLLDIAASSTRNPVSCDAVPDSAVVAGIDYAVNHPAGPVDVINLSIGSPQGYCPEHFDTAFRSAQARGVVVVASAGNEGPGSVSVPGACPGVVAVAATDRDGNVASYASANRWVTLAAPGGAGQAPAGLMLTTNRLGGVTAVRGSSFSAGYVSGVVALLRDLAPGLPPDLVTAVLQHTADRIGVDEDPVRLRLRADAAAAMVAYGEEIPMMRHRPFFPVLRLEEALSGPQAVRVGPSDQPSNAISQAAAVSQAAFKDGGAVHVVLARDDDYADALAGSALGFGMGPLLFTPPRLHLAEETFSELQRVLPAGGRVYVLGGEEAVGSPAVGELASAGYDVVRLAGSTREGTAAAVARETRRRVPDLGFPAARHAVIATRENWPDAVSAGSLAAMHGIPVLLTPPAELHAETAQALAELRPEHLWVVGGSGAVSDEVLDAAAAAAGGTASRLSGPSRHETALAVSRRILDSHGRPPRYAMAINMRRPDGFAYALAASVLAGAHTGIFVPVEQTADVTTLAGGVRDVVGGTRLQAVLIGGPDIVPGEVGAELHRLLHEQP